MAQQHPQPEPPSEPAAAPPAPAAQSIERVVAALQDPTRRGILLAFYADPTPRSVDDVAAAAGVHRTVAFGHLERLRALGFLQASQRRGLPGKPAKLYRLIAGPLQLHHPARQFAILAGLLAEGLRGMGDAGIAAAHAVGRRQGAALARQAGPDAPAGVLAPLSHLGGDYTVETDRVLARNCIFEEACACAPEIVCELHAGLIEGALGAAGVARRVTPCDGGAHAAAVCVYRLDSLPA